MRLGIGVSAGKVSPQFNPPLSLTLEGTQRTPKTRKKKTTRGWCRFGNLCALNEGILNNLLFCNFCVLVEEFFGSCLECNIGLVY